MPWVPNSADGKLRRRKTRQARTPGSPSDTAAGLGVQPTFVQLKTPPPPPDMRASEAPQELKRRQGPLSSSDPSASGCQWG